MYNDEFDIYEQENFLKEFSGKTIFSDNELRSIRNRMYNIGVYNCQKNDPESILAFLNLFKRYSLKECNLKYGHLYNSLDKESPSILDYYTDIVKGDFDTYLIVDFDLQASIQRCYNSCNEISYDGEKQGTFKVQCPKCNSYNVFGNNNYGHGYKGSSVYYGTTHVCKDCGYID